MECHHCSKSIPEDAAKDKEAVCPSCGKVLSHHAAIISPVEVTTTVAHVAASAIMLYDSFLDIARQMLTDKQYEMAVVSSHVACEIAAERAISCGFATRSCTDLEKPVTNLLNGYNLANHRVRKLYKALTTDDVGAQTFWKVFKISAERRNAIIHQGKRVSETDASASLEACKALVSHLKRANRWP
jgi:hypothetical protein